MNNPPRNLIVGSDGTIGSALLRYWSRGQAVGTTRRLPVSANQIYLDCSGDLKNWHIPVGTQVLINCAAVAGLEACKRDPVNARRVNVDSVITLAEKCRRASVHFVHLSTDKVFSGQRPCMPPDAPFAPTTEYGRQKADAERYLLELLALGESLAIIRLTKVISPAMTLFRAWRDALCRAEIIHPFADMTLAPLPLPFVVEAIARAADARCSGIFQLSGERDISYREVALRLAEYLSLESGLIQPIDAAETSAFREAIAPYTSLDSRETQRTLAVRCPATLDTIDWAFSTL